MQKEILKIGEYELLKDYRSGESFPKNLLGECYFIRKTNEHPAWSLAEIPKKVYEEAKSKTTKELDEIYNFWYHYAYYVENGTLRR
jgi:hypothetical protein